MLIARASFILFYSVFQILSCMALAEPAVPVAASTTPSLPAEEADKSVVLNFLEWKAQRVQEAQKKLEQVNKANSAASQWQEGKSTLETSDEQKLNFNVDVALQLNIHDYFSMYMKLLSNNEYKEASKKLSDDEKTELLLAYKNISEKEKRLPLKMSKIPKDNAKNKNQEIQ